MIHPDTELRFISPEIGYGVVATKLIPKGTITWAMDKLDRKFKPSQVAKLDPLYKDILDTYSYRSRDGDFILCWDNSRFVNHSFNSSCLTTAYEFEIAVRDILPGEELTDDYGYLNISEPFEAVPEKGSKRKIVYPDDLLRYHEQWDKKIMSAMKQFAKVDQPLQFLVSNENQKKIQSAIDGKAQLDSILTCYYDESAKVSS